MYQDIYVSPVGSLILIAHHAKLMYCNWNLEEEKPVYKKIFKIAPPDALPGDIKVIAEAKKQLQEYFSGLRKGFNLPLSLHGSPFQMKVWSEIASIPYGETVSYRQLAESIGKVKATRAVASACGANPLAVVIPCHRVVASNGKPGGYAGGNCRKLFLLDLEFSLPNLRGGAT